jgi:hypothetical protein
VVRMLYAVSQPSGGTKRMVILCAFDPSTVPGRVPAVSAVSVNGRQLGPARLTFLNRFWLPSEEAAASLPAGGPALPAQSREATPFAPGESSVENYPATTISSFNALGLDCDPGEWVLLGSLRHKP